MEHFEQYAQPVFADSPDLRITFAFLREQTNDEASAVAREDQAGDEAPTEPDDAQSRRPI